MNTLTRRVAAIALAGGIGILGLTACSDDESDCDKIKSADELSSSEVDDQELKDAVDAINNAEGDPEAAQAAVDVIVEKCDINLDELQ